MFLLFNKLFALFGYGEVNFLVNSTMILDWN